MPWSVRVGPLRYTEAAGNKPVLRGPVLVLAGFAAAGLIVAVLVLFVAVVVTAWLTGLVVGFARGNPALYSSRYAQAVVGWGRDLIGM